MTKILRLTLVAGSITLVACSNPTESHGPPTNLSAESPTSFEFSAGVSGADSVVVRIVDSRGRSVPNVQVAWTTNSESVVKPEDVLTVTGPQGTTGTRLLVGTRSGATSVAANILVDGKPVAQSFDVVVNAGPPVRVEMDSLVLVLPHPSSRTLAVRAYDEYGNLHSGTAAVWTSSRGAIVGVSDAGVISSTGVGAAVVTARVGDATAAVEVWVIPPVISACEWNTGRVCSTWTLNSDGIYDVVADDGGTAWHEIVDMREDGRIEVERTDWGMNKDFTGRYVGTISDSTAAGQVTWTQHGFSWSGTWSASW